MSAASIAQSAVLRVLMGGTLLSRAFIRLRLSGHVNQAEYTENRTFLKSRSLSTRDWGRVSVLLGCDTMLLGRVY